MECARGREQSAGGRTKTAGHRAAGSIRPALTRGSSAAASISIPLAVRHRRCARRTACPPPEELRSRLPLEACGEPSAWHRNTSHPRAYHTCPSCLHAIESVCNYGSGAVPSESLSMVSTSTWLSIPQASPLPTLAFHPAPA